MEEVHDEGQRADAEQKHVESGGVSMSSEAEGDAGATKGAHSGVDDETDLSEPQPTRNDEEAASRIQSSFRGWQERRKVAEQQYAATRIQAVYRGKKARQKVKDEHSFQRHEVEKKAGAKGVHFAASTDEPQDKVVIGEEGETDQKLDGEELEEEVDEEPEELTPQKLEELLRMAAEEQEQLQQRNLNLQKTLAQYLDKKKADEVPHAGERSVLDMEKLYRTNLKHVREQRQGLSDLQEELDHKTLESQARLQDKEKLVAHATQGLIEYRRNVSSQAEHARTGRALSRQSIQQFEGHEAGKDKAVHHVRLRYISLRNRLQKLEAALRAKEDLGEGLHLIDFQQLKIENHSLAEKIEERNEEVLKLRKKITHTVQMLTHLKEKQQFVQNENMELMRRLHEIEDEVSEHQQVLSQIKRERDQLRMLNSQMRQESGLMGKADLLSDFEKRKEELEQKRAQLAELHAKHLAMLAEIQMLQPSDLDKPRIAPMRTGPHGGNAAEYRGGIPEY